MIIFGGECPEINKFIGGQENAKSIKIEV